MRPVLCVSGMRPEAIKMVPVVGRLRETWPRIKWPSRRRTGQWCWVVRTEAERPESVTADAPPLIGLERAAICENALRLIDDAQAREATIVERSRYSDGQSARWIVNALAKRYGGGADTVGLAH